MTDVLTWVAGVLMIAGGIFALGGAIGVLRFPDVFTRMHAASKAGIAGSGLALVAVALAAHDTGVSVRALLALVFFMMTTPLAAHLVARAALRAGHVPLSTTVDEDNRTSELTSAEQKPDFRPKSS